MAQKRMFSLKIVDTDKFVDMPLSTRLLYYDLAMRADDDGFIGSAKKITKMIGCSDDDLKILIAKQFLIPFENGVCVIKDWRIHNYIQKDRYQPTQYIDEKNQLNADFNGSYQLCIQDVHEMDTQVRLDKVRLEIGKERIANLQNYYETKIGLMTSTVLSDIKSFVDVGFEDDLVIRCLEKAIECNARNKWAYAKSILKSLLDKDVRTLAEFEKQEGKPIDKCIFGDSSKNPRTPRLDGVTYL